MLDEEPFSVSRADKKREKIRNANLSARVDDFSPDSPALAGARKEIFQCGALSLMRRVLLDRRAGAATDTVGFPGGAHGPGGPAGFWLEQRVAFRVGQPLALRGFLFAHHFIDGP